MAEEVPQTKPGTHKEVLLPIVLAIILYASDFLTKFDGLNIPKLTQGKTVFFMFSQGVVAVVAAVTILYYLLSGGKKSKRMIILSAILGFVCATILVFGGFNLGVLLHLLFPWFVILLLKEPSDNEETLATKRIVGYFIDFFAFGIVSILLNNSLLGNRLILPIWVLYAIWKGYQHAESSTARTILSVTIIVIVIVYMGAFVDGLRIMDEYQKFGPDKVRDFKDFLADSLENLKSLGTEIRTSWNETYNSIFNPTSYLPGTQETTENPQGIFLEALEPGHIFTEGMPVYAWALLEARRLDETSIKAKLSCTTVRETEFGEYEIFGQVDPSEIEVVKGAERSISCEFLPLPEDDYEILFMAEFNFSADARRKVYLMDRERMLNDYRLLSQKGLTPTRENILREIYEITDTNPELIYTSGPISLGMNTEYFFWDVGKPSQPSLKPLFGITIENDWSSGGKIKRINNLYFKVPDDMVFREDLCDPNTPVEQTNEQSEPGYNVYRLKTEEFTGDREKILIDIDEFRTFNCRIEVDQNTLDNIPITTRFLKVHVDYDYVLEEELGIEVEGDDIGEGREVEGRNLFCCQVRIKDMITNTWEISHYEQTPTLEECYLKTESHVRATDVDSEYCEQMCCEVTYIEGDDKNHYWVENEEACNDLDSNYGNGELTAKSNCDIE